MREAGIDHKRLCGPQQRTGALCHVWKAPLNAPVWIVACKATHGGKDPSVDDAARFGRGGVNGADLDSGFTFKVEKMRLGEHHGRRAHKAC